MRGKLREEAESGFASCDTERKDHVTQWSGRACVHFENPLCGGYFSAVLSQVYAIFDRAERRLAFSGHDARVGKIVTAVLAANPVLRAYVRERLRSAGEIVFPGIDEPD
jgi:hypothetical protein